MGNWFENTKEFVGPLIAVCSRCAKHQRLIDRAIDGYNAEIGDPFPDEDEANDMWFCIRCNNKEGRLIASFGYQYDLDTTEPRLQDYFDCFLLTHTCLTSASTIQVAMQDCA